MKSTSQRRTAIAALLLAPALVACGFNVQTDQVYQAATGVNDRDGAVDVLNAVIVSGSDGSGTLAVTLVNNDQDDAHELTGITGDDSTATMEAIEVPANGLVNLAESGAVAITGDRVEPGNFVTLTLDFADGQTTELRVPVVAHEDEYDDVPLPKQTKPAAEATE